MPYSYGYDANMIYFALLLPVLLFSLYAQVQVNGNFSRYSQMVNRRGLTGAQAAIKRERSITTSFS